MKPSSTWRVGLISASIVMLILCTLIVALADTSKQAEPFKIGFLCVGAISDHGWNYAHNKGRLEMEKQLSGKVQTSLVERIPENAEAERVLEKMIAQGNKLIFTTSYGFLEPTLKVAQRHPDIIFIQVNRFQTAKNLSSYLSNQYQPMYLAGMVAGRMTKTNMIGFIAAHPVPQVLQNINALALGARSVNPKVKVHVVWTNKWSDPAIEAEAAKGLIDAGVDVLAMHLDSPLTVVKTAEKNKIYCVGYHADIHKIAPKAWLTGAMWNWGPLYVQIAKSINNHSWKPGNYRYSMKDGYVKLSPFGSAVPKAIQNEALSIKKRIDEGQYTVFQGPLKDRNGKQLLSAGQKPDLNFIESMNWLAPGVEGTLPKE